MKASLNKRAQAQKPTTPRLSFHTIVRFNHDEKAFPVSLSKGSDGSFFLGNREHNGFCIEIPVSLRCGAAWFLACRFLCGKPTEIDDGLFKAHLSDLLKDEPICSVDLPVIPAIAQLAERSGLPYNTVAVAFLTLATAERLQTHKP